MFSYPTPFTPPTTEDDRLSWLRLIRSHRVGVATFYRLLAEHGTAQEALAALPDLARAAGVRNYDPCPEAVAIKELKTGRLAGAQLLCMGEPSYPAALAETSDAPPVVWHMGDVAILNRPMIAIVGARGASSLGMRMARRLAQGLGQAGYVVVSGLARGIDAEAHRSSLATGTVAVMAGGVDHVYPAENAALAAEIASKGLRISEQPPGLEPMVRHFPMRNRIIAGMARAVVVVEAAAQSGSLITARMALDLGREVLAVPGHPFDGRAAGCNMLIRDGATLVRGPEDVLAAIGSLAETARTNDAPDRRRPARNDHPRPVRDPAPASGSAADRAERNPLHGRILHHLGPSPLSEDQLIRDLALSAAEVAPELVLLEMEGQIQRAPGGLLMRA
ncbi:DNA-processing protein DprA [Defluviimonas sp. WL0002]|uniref:DNA-processing protein DprA n=1 Tax=Albidovulum marisflavi TaxID=2984159 RepID=A0ABT2ZAA4_9RHOB|nr:DNA-processing protein DprA [Defluviimonas sp. WL0002]MCV2868031.1 DNA-processing protein DprA [Defluviimonas sp. WL0002]